MNVFCFQSFQCVFLSCTIFLLHLCLKRNWSYYPTTSSIIMLYYGKLFLPCNQSLSVIADLSSTKKTGASTSLFEIYWDWSHIFLWLREEFPGSTILQQQHSNALVGKCFCSKYKFLIHVLAGCLYVWHAGL